MLGIYVGSGQLRDFDAALVPYAGDAAHAGKFEGCSSFPSIRWSRCDSESPRAIFDELRLAVVLSLSSRRFRVPRGKRGRRAARGAARAPAAAHRASGGRAGGHPRGKDGYRHSNGARVIRDFHYQWIAFGLRAFGGPANEGERFERGLAVHLWTGRPHHDAALTTLRGETEHVLPSLCLELHREAAMQPSTVVA